MVSAIIIGTILLIFLFVCLVTFLVTCIGFVGWVPTSKKDLKRIAKIISPKPGQIIYDLGAGNGRIVFYLSKKFKQAKIVGLELALPLFLLCKLKKLFYFNKNISFKWHNLFNEDLSQVDIIYVFGIPNKLEKKLKHKFKKELKPGAKVVSYVFKIKGLKPSFVSKPDKNSKSIYVYKF